MTDDEWDAISILLDKGFKWREPFGEVHAATYRTLLDGYSAQTILEVIRALVARGQVFGPAPGEIVALIRTDPSLPTGPEALTLIYGPRGVMKARPAYPPGGWSGNEFLNQRDEVQQARAFELHPVLGAFVRSYGLDRLRMLEVDDPEWGEKHRRDLAADWERFAEQHEVREVASLTAGRRGEGLRRVDPLDALDVRRPVAQLEAPER